MKKFLLVAYAFPPKNVVGALRPYRLCRYLPDYDWLPTVITARINKARHDQSVLRKEIPDNVRILETPTMDFVRTAEQLFGKFKRQRDASHTSRLGPLRHISADKLQYNKEAPNTAAKRFMHIIREVISTPDNNIFWGICTLQKGIKVLFNTPKEYHAIVTTSPPHSSQLFGSLLAKCFRIPHVMDLRDPWIDVYRGYQTPVRRWIENKMEAAVVRWSKFIISSTDAYTELLCNRYSHLASERFQTITNSFEEEKFDAIQGQDLQKFTMAYLGIFYPRRNPYCFFKALNAWLIENPDKRNQIEFRIIGGSDPSTDAMIRQENLTSVVRVTGRLSHEEAIENAKSADLLLLLMGTGEDTPIGWIPSKLFEYLACRKPILANIPDGTAGRIIRETKSGFVVTSNDAEQVKAIIDQEFKRKQGETNSVPPFTPDEVAIRRFGTKATTRKFSQLLDEIVK